MLLQQSQSFNKILPGLYFIFFTAFLLLICLHNDFPYLGVYGQILASRFCSGSHDLKNNCIKGAFDQFYYKSMNQNNFEITQQTSNHKYDEQDQKKQEVRRLNRSTPLAFALRINGNYYISYKRQQFWSMLIRSVLWTIVNILLISFLRSFQNINSTVKGWIEFGLIIQVALHFLICFMDAGTIFEDEQDNYQEERNYCVTCSLYRVRSSKHCVFCNRCVRNYDHHCSVFGKCIGRRNLVPFWLFILVSGLEMPAFILVLVSQIFNGQ